MRTEDWVPDWLVFFFFFFNSLQVVKGAEILVVRAKETFAWVHDLFGFNYHNLENSGENGFLQWKIPFKVYLSFNHYANISQLTIVQRKLFRATEISTFYPQNPNRLFFRSSSTYCPPCKYIYVSGRHRSSSCVIRYFYAILRKFRECSFSLSYFSSIDTDTGT